MYKVIVNVQTSNIDGKGFFTKQDIEKNTILWQYDEGYDHAISQAEFDALSSEEKEYLHRVAYLSPWSNLWARAASLQIIRV